MGINYRLSRNFVLVNFMIIHLPLHTEAFFQGSLAVKVNDLLR